MGKHPPPPIVPGELLDELVSRGSPVRCPRMGGCGRWVDRLLIVAAENRTAEALLMCPDCLAKKRKG